jgi:hypothetical protein
MKIETLLLPQSARLTNRIPIVFALHRRHRAITIKLVQNVVAAPSNPVTIEHSPAAAIDRVPERDADGRIPDPIFRQR